MDSISHINLFNKIKYNKKKKNEIKSYDYFLIVKITCF